MSCSCPKVSPSFQRTRRPCSFSHTHTRCCPTLTPARTHAFSPSSHTKPTNCLISFAGKRLEEPKFQECPVRSDLPYQPVFVAENQAFVFQKQISYGAYGLVDQVFCNGVPMVIKWEKLNGSPCTVDREAEILKQLRGLNFVPEIRMAGRAMCHGHQLAFVIMNLLPGCTLYSLMSQWHNLGKLLPLFFALDVIEDLIVNVYVLHSYFIVHGDLHPSNLLVDPTVFMSPSVKILDFGLSGRNLEVTSPVGNVWMCDSPRRIGNFAQALPDTRVYGDDWWSVAILAIQLLEGYYAVALYHTKVDANGVLDVASLNTLRAYQQSLIKRFCPARPDDSPRRGSGFSQISPDLPDVNPGDLSHLIGMIMELRDTTELETVRVQKIYNHIRKLKGSPTSSSISCYPNSSSAVPGSFHPTPPEYPPPPLPPSVNRLVGHPMVMHNAAPGSQKCHDVLLTDSHNGITAPERACLPCESAKRVRSLASQENEFPRSVKHCLHVPNGPRNCTQQRTPSSGSCTSSMQQVMQSNCTLYDCPSIPTDSDAPYMRFSAPQLQSPSELHTPCSHSDAEICKMCAGRTGRVPAKVTGRSGASTLTPALTGSQLENAHLPCHSGLIARNCGAPPSKHAGGLKPQLKVNVSFPSPRRALALGLTHCSCPRLGGKGKREQ